MKITPAGADELDGGTMDLEQPCLLCGVVPERSGPHGGYAAVPQPDGRKMQGFFVAPYGATQFQTGGHYGSTFWDSFEGELLQITVCDACLETSRARLVFLRPVRRHPTVYEPFKETPDAPR